MAPIRYSYLQLAIVPQPTWPLLNNDSGYIRVTLATFVKCYLITRYLTIFKSHLSSIEGSQVHAPPQLFIKILSYFLQIILHLTYYFLRVSFGITLLPFKQYQSYNVQLLNNKIIGGYSFNIMLMGDKFKMADGVWLT